MMLKNIIFLFLIIPAALSDDLDFQGCAFPGAPAHSNVEFNQDPIQSGTVARYSCDRGFELLGPARRVCSTNGTWVPQGIPFCVLNVAAGKAPMQSSVSEGGIPQKAVDGSTSTFYDSSTCTLTEVERSPWWYVNLLEPYMVQLVRIDFGQSCCAKGRKATIVVRVGNNRPDLGVNPICNRFTGSLEEGRPLFLPCNPPMPGAFVSVHFESPAGVSLSICETFVYTDQALPIERCPTFRDQPPGSTATYNGKCYIFYNQQPLNFQGAMEFCDSRGGTLVDESNPALQGFLSWELWRRHKGDANGQYWLGAVRDRDDPKNWKWITGNPVTVSFWNLPGGNDDCARFDGTKGWLWSDTNCGLKLNFICQHRPTTCGKPEQPPNSTLVAPNFRVGSRIEYECDDGHLLVGPAQRSCLPTGFYSEFPPVCRYLECGVPADIENGRLVYLNETVIARGFKSVIEYQCDIGYVAVGRTELMCDVDERWNGPPPRCDPVYCEEPLPIRHGGFSLSTNSTALGTVVSYYCTSAKHNLVGKSKLTCLVDGSWDGPTPECISDESADVRPLRSGAGVLQTTETPLPKRRTPPFRRKPITKEVVEEDPVQRPRSPVKYSKDEPNEPARFPIDNEIPDSVNVQANQPPDVSVPGSVENSREARQQQLNLGGIIALGVFGGFVFLAAIITTIVILIRRIKYSRRYRKSPKEGTQASPESRELAVAGNSQPSSQNRYYIRAWEAFNSTRRAKSVSKTDQIVGGSDPTRKLNIVPTIQPSNLRSFLRKDTKSISHQHIVSGHGSDSSASSRAGYRPRLGSSEEVRDESEMVVTSYTKPDKQRHHHHHHHKHKHNRPKEEKFSRH